jgi:low affinity Fe/Cu permease
MHELFRKFSAKTSQVMGTSWAFLGAVLIIIIWAISGPIFDFSDTWQLVINTSTTIVTFLMVFLIQNTQNRDAKALHLKLDTLIQATKGAKNDIMDAEDLSDSELDELKEMVNMKIQQQRARRSERQAQTKEETVMVVEQHSEG